MNNNLPENNHAASPDVLAEAVNQHLAVSSEKPSPEFHARCQAAALGALDVLRMRACRAQLANQPGSLLEHFEGLARLAGVGLDQVFPALGLAHPEASDTATARGLARLARQLGLAHDEASRRLRWGFAKLAGAMLPPTWDTSPLPVRARRPRGTVRRQDAVEEALRRSEAAYPAARRAELRAAVNVVLEEYEHMV